MSNEKRWWIGIIGGGLFAALGMGGLIYMEHGKITKKREEVATLRTQIESARALIEGTGTLEREVIVLREVSEVIKGILPDEEDVNNLVRTLNQFSTDTSVAITGLKKKNDAAGAQSSFDKVSYTLSLAADAFQLMDFFDAIESHSRFMRIPTFRITAAQRQQLGSEGVPAHKVQLDVETFVYDPQKISEPVRIEGYERKRDLLMGEISRRREALTVTTYSYRGARGRRDPWIDPRVPVDGDGGTALSVQEQMDIVQELFDRTQEVLKKWAETKEAENVIVEMMARSQLEEQLTSIEEDLRRVQNEGSVRYVPAERRLQIEVTDVITDLRDQLNNSDAGRGPSEETLAEVIKAMNSHMELGEFDLMLEAFSVVDGRLALAENDPLRQPYVDRLRKLAAIARTVIDFEDYQMSIGGTAIIEGRPSVVLINGRSYEIGDMLNNELVVHSIAADEVEFLFRGVILARRF